jgi:hypothetical protein
MNKTNEDGAAVRDDNRRRQRLIEQCLAALGKAWASRWFQEMSLDSRSIEGGWPGRLGEARTLALRELTNELTARGMAPPSASELAGAPGTVNEHARQEWLRAGKAQRLALRGAR